MDSVKPAKDRWDKTQIVATVAATILIPVALAVSSSWINDNLKDRELTAQKFAQERDRQLRMFEVAVGILQKDPKGGSEISALRKWAIEVFVAFSGKQIPEEARRELEKKPLPRVNSSASSLVGEFMPGQSLPGGPAVETKQKR